MRVLRRAALSVGADRVARRLTADRAVLLMLHRSAPRDPFGIDERALARAIDWARTRGGYRFVALESVFDPALRDRSSGKKVLSVSIDDGYADQVERIGMTLDRFEVPSTLFVTTGFVDRDFWMWWDRVRYATANARRRRIPALRPGDAPIEWGSTASEAAAAATLAIAILVTVPEARRLAVLSELGAWCDVEIPREPPPEYAPTSWERLRQWTDNGFATLGPHTLTHPILSRTDDAQCRAEIIGSWETLRARSRATAPVFCFPNGTAADFGEREMALVRAAGLRGAISALPGAIRLTSQGVGGGTALPRYNFPEELDEFRQVISGITDLRNRLRP